MLVTTTTRAATAAEAVAYHGKNPQKSNGASYDVTMDERGNWKCSSSS